MNEGQIFELIGQGKRFIDLTEEANYRTEEPTRDDLVVFPKVRQMSTVKALSAKIDLGVMRKFLTKFSSFHTRYYKSTYGKESSEWLLKHLSVIAENAKPGVSVTVEPFSNPWVQSSIIVRIVPAYQMMPDEEVTIVSAHQDSINQRDPRNGAAPGADDDGSGTVTIIEALRLIVDSGFIPASPLEFHFYSAEEAGLLGSQLIASAYKSRGVKVKGAFQVDMTGYLKPGTKPVIGISTDNVNPMATQFLRDLADEYCDIDRVNTKCGYGCSDHVSWTRKGYPSAFVFESTFRDHSPYIHSVKDDISTVSFEHIAEFTKLVLGWAIELSS
ncbi:MAG: hypothetical protein SGCHY_002676 [Lobulomycetales sp.]